MKTKIILATGKAQAGKSTSCAFLAERLTEMGYSCKIYNFADPLKEFCINVLGLNREDVYGDNNAKNKLSHIKWKDLPLSVSEISSFKKTNEVYLTVREVLQIFGTEICRRMYGDCWALATLNRIYQDNLDFALIADVRFPNEVEAAELKNNFERFNDKINNSPYVLRLLRNPLNLKHKSETALDTYDFKRFKGTVLLNQSMDIEVRNIDLKIVAKILVKDKKIQEEAELGETILG